ncbi:ATP-dependent DNA ligase [Nocardioides sp. cx-173]|uniref:ATP-dependent DNA ligase n=1 Tax=Nocardioides sp. cx-173 TaxID=2898796 RepID=UPI001E4FC517|nr:ATP-dependent DNA ligase [Nocardioides sp. cx-173]MCD4526702.1 ATP-dependent DNA ligase [Nocardioides sp. cx-173]UGB42556.1 ATP-dependent DNA ligase [Nocardioides sp. cx-173]
MDLPVMPPVQPMLAKAVKGVPDPAKYGELVFEPKWDGFRCLVFKDGDEVELTSRNTKPLTRYFPEVVEAVRAQLPQRCVVDGELFVASISPDGDRLEFEVLQERIHPAASRVRLLSETTPAGLVVFDLLALGDTSYVDRPLRERRAALEESFGDLAGPCYLTRTTTDPAVAEEWFTQFEGAGLDGVIAKPLDAPYSPNGRTMMKVKHERTADVVVCGYREHKTSTPERPLLGSLLLGLWADGHLQHVGVSASFTEARRAELLQELQPLVCDISEHPWSAWAGPESAQAIANPDRVPGTQSRWSAGKDLSFTPLRPERVLEVKYDAMEGRRFRHTAHFKRWRPDRDPESCGYEQLEQPVRYDLATVLRGVPTGSGPDDSMGDTDG